jgi:hypothetical protein
MGEIEGFKNRDNLNEISNEDSMKMKTMRTDEKKN